MCVANECVNIEASSLSERLTKADLNQNENLLDTVIHEEWTSHTSFKKK